MKAAIIFLIILFFLMLVLMLSIIFHKENPAKRAHGKPANVPQFPPDPPIEQDEIMENDTERKEPQAADIRKQEDSFSILFDEKALEELLREEKSDAGISSFMPPDAPDQSEFTVDSFKDSLLRTRPYDKTAFESTEILTPVSENGSDLNELSEFDLEEYYLMLNEQKEKPLSEEPDFLPYETVNETEPEFVSGHITGSEADDEPDFDTDADIFIHRPVIEETDSESAMNAELLRSGVRMAWPDSDVMMVSTAFKGSVLYIWEGLSRGTDLILFDVHDNKLGYPLLETAKRISDGNLMPASKFAILIHTDSQDESWCRQAASAFLRSERQTPAAVISDYAQQYDTEGVLAGYEMIGVGVKPHVILCTETPPETVNKIASLSMKKQKPDRISETAVEAFDRMGKDLSFSARSRISLSVGVKGAARKIANEIPETAEWINPVFETSRDGNLTFVTIYAPDDTVLESTLDEFRENMRRSNYTFRVLKQQNETVPASVYDDAFIMLERAYEAAGIGTTLIPVLAREDYAVRGIRTLSIPSDRMERRTAERLLEKLLLER